MAITDALAACRLFQVMHDEIGDDYYEMRTALKQHAIEFENLAIGVLDECFNEDEDVSEMVVERNLSKWEGMCALNLAAAAKAERFLAHPCC
ncbi:PREDICTED: transient receptor potential channel-like [Acropora digitifera]|nr:PREDICTED: transient receptor potential channel-like [Acropora digitifera]